MTVRVDDIVGTWLLVHDDFEGVLTIRPPDQRQVAEDPPCSYDLPFGWFATKQGVRPNEWE